MAAKGQNSTQSVIVIESEKKTRISKYQQLLEERDEYFISV